MNNKQNHVAKEDWRTETNDRYQDVVRTVINLATSALVLPILLLKELFNIPREIPLIKSLNYKAFMSWAFLSLAILFGGFFIIHLLSGSNKLRAERSNYRNKLSRKYLTVRFG